MATSAMINMFTLVIGETGICTQHSLFHNIQRKLLKRVIRDPHVALLFNTCELFL